MVSNLWYTYITYTARVDGHSVAGEECEMLFTMTKEKDKCNKKSAKHSLRNSCHGLTQVPYASLTSECTPVFWLASPIPVSTVGKHPIRF